MNKITLESKKFTITKIYKNGRKFLKNASVGDELFFSIPIKSAGSNRGTYASYIRVDNLTKDEHTFESFNQIGGLFNKIELEQKVN